LLDVEFAITEPMTLAAGTLLGPYEILSPLGAGGMGEVYRARDARLSREVAIKVLPAAFAADSGFLARFQREAQSLAALNHPNVAHIYGLEKSAGIDALVLELVEGETLAERIARGPVPVPEALEIARQIGDALEAAHEKGIVHRDLKPANVKVTPEGRVKVLDFGLAKAVAGDTLSSDATQSPTLTAAATKAGVVIGTAAYMSPEQARGQAVDKRADIWAFGAVLYEMLTGKRAFGGDTVSDTLASVLVRDPDWSALPTSTTSAVRRVIKRCLDRNPKTRLHDIADARLEMDETVDAGEPSAAPVVVAARRGRHTVWLLVASLGAATIAAILASGFWKRNPIPARTMRFEVGIPSEVTAYGLPVISPDGRILAFDAVDSTGKRRIWIRPLDALQAHPLPGTEGTGRVFWSPDSRYLGFFTNGNLQKVDVSGGPPQKICDAPTGQSGSWGPNGVIVFDGSGDKDPIWRVPARGGSPVPLVEGVNIGWPEFLPDGKHFLYSSIPSKATAMGRIASLDSKETLPVGPVESQMSYVEPGYVLFVRGGTLVAQPFDAKVLKTTGEALPLAERVGTDRFFESLFSVSREGTLAYRTGRFASPLVWVDRGGKEIETVGDPAQYLDPALSPDGHRLIVEAVDGKIRESDLWVRDLSRNVNSRLTFSKDDREKYPVWSVDGERVAYTLNSDLVERPADGQGTDTPLVKSDELKYASDWSVDGRYMAFVSRSKSDNVFDIWILPTFGDRKPFAWLKSPFNKFQAVFSPDGRYIAYTSYESGRAEIYVKSFPGPGGKWQISSGGGLEPHWRADGKELFYLSEGGSQGVMAVDVTTGDRFEARVPKPLFSVVPGYGGNRYFYPSKDGQRFLLAAKATGDTTSPTTIVLNWMADLGK
jgi:Tol biopolymer transport system component